MAFDVIHQEADGNQADRPEIQPGQSVHGLVTVQDALHGGQGGVGGGRGVKQKCGPCGRGQKGWKMENVRIRLFKDNSRYKGDLFVSVNGVNYKIRRGVEVEVPPEVAEVLEHSQQQDERTAARIAAAEMSDT